MIGPSASLRTAHWPLALVSSVLVGMAALPFVTAVSPDWPRAGTRLPLILAGLLLLFVLGRLWLGRPVTSQTLQVLVCFALYSLYTGNGVVLTSGDTAAIRALPANILVRHTLDFSQTQLDRSNPPYAVLRSGGRLVSLFPSGTAFIALPHAAFALLGSGGLVTPELVSRWEKHAAALISVGAAAFLWAAARRWGDGAALGATLVFGLATPVTTNAAQALWSFTGETFCLAVALFLVLRPRPFYACAGFVAGTAFACRPTALVAAVAIGLALLVTNRRSAARFSTGLAITLVAVCAAQFAVYGHPLGAYGAVNMARGAFNAEFVRGLAGVLASPSRGLLVFCPWVALLPIGLILTKRRRDGLFTWVLMSLVAGVGSVVLAAAHLCWWGGWSLGPRLLTEAAPFLALACIPLLSASSRSLRGIFLLLFTFASITQFLLAYMPRAWDWDRLVLDRVGQRALWEWEHGQLAAAWGASVPPGSIAPVTTPGGEDILGSIDEPAEGARITGRLNVRGWARIPEADVLVTVYLDGAARTPVSAVRTARPELCKVIPSLRDCASAGYDIAFDFGPQDSGQHEIVAVFRAPDGRVRRYPVRSFVWKSE
jgi:hypothetical protein